MGANDVILLGDMIEATRLETSHLEAAAQEAYFFAKHRLKHLNPTHDDILSGIVDGPLDGGIDTMHIFVNGLSIRDDASVKSMGRNASLELHIGQVKNTTGFSEASVDRLTTNLPAILNFGRDEGALAGRFNPRLLEVSRRFLATVRDLELPELKVYISFASLRAEGDAHPNVYAKCDALIDSVKRSFGSCSPTIEFLDAAGLGTLARSRSRTTKRLMLSENPISTDTQGGYIGVVSLTNYYEFICEPAGRLDSGLFEANVRDYDSDSSVNRSIQATLESSDGAVDFWWLNNGVTIVADKIYPAGKELTLDSPQVVNGLQTSHEIYKRGSIAELDGSHSVLVKVVQASAEETRDRIIKATNSQTTLGTSAIRATDRVQRKIEEYLSSIGLYYERRKNFYRNQSVNLTQLVSIDQLGQAVTGSLVQFPHVARATPSRLFEDDIYELVFADGHPLQMYGQVLTTFRACEAFLRADSTTRNEVENYAHHLGMVATIAMTRKKKPNAHNVADLNRAPTPDLLRDLLPIVRTAFGEVVQRKGYALFDQVAKDPYTTERVLDGAHRYLLSSPRPT